MDPRFKRGSCCDFSVFRYPQNNTHTLLYVMCFGSILCGKQCNSCVAFCGVFVTIVSFVDNLIMECFKEFSLEIESIHNKLKVNTK